MYRLGLYNCQTKKTISRQISEDEKLNENIGGLEALALEMCILNIDMAKQPRVVRYGYISLKNLFNLFNYLSTESTWIT